MLRDKRVNAFHESRFKSLLFETFVKYRLEYVKADLLVYALRVKVRKLFGCQLYKVFKLDHFVSQYFYFGGVTLEIGHVDVCLKNAVRFKVLCHFARYGNARLSQDLAGKRVGNGTRKHSAPDACAKGELLVVFVTSYAGKVISVNVKEHLL